jgi:hypothetical protein
MLQTEALISPKSLNLASYTQGLEKRSQEKEPTLNQQMIRSDNLCNEKKK